ncbi:MAG TPA: hypothetical protein VD963_11415 [Phycisphaerales bacterium]|nr:hypothetical protein [Phycisphaerales bacterium]
MVSPGARRRGPGERILKTLGGVYELVRLALVARQGRRGPYWSWRLMTAFGRGYPESRRELARSVIEYGRWVRMMRRGW